MATQLQLRRDDETDLASATPVVGEPGYDTTNKNLLVGDGSRSGGVPHVSYAHDQTQRFKYASSVGGTADVITIALNEDLDAYVEGVAIEFKAGSANTGAVTVNVSGLGAKDLKKYEGGAEVDLVADDIATGQIIRAVYDGTNFQIGGLGGGGGAILVASATISGTPSTQDFTDVFQLGFNYRIELTNIVPVSDGVQFRMRLRTGSSFITANYNNVYHILPANSGFGGANSTIDMNTSSGSAAGEHIDGTVYLKNPMATATKSQAHGSIAYISSSGAANFSNFSGFSTTASAINGIQFYFNTGNLESGTISIYEEEIPT